MMRSSPKITRVQLEINQNNESVLIGIVSAEPDYKLSLSLNRKLKISLKNADPVMVKDEPGAEKTFSRFSFTAPSHGQGFELISNRFGKNFLVRKLRNIDFILQIHNPESPAAVEKIISVLRGTESITAVFNIDIKSLKDKNLHYLIL